MARTSAMNAVASAVLTALNVAGVRTLCPGGVYRTVKPMQAPPYLIVGRCAEVPDDALGSVNYGARVTVPLMVVQVTADAVPDARAADILSAALALIDEPAALAVTGWNVRQVQWVGTQPTTFLDVANEPVDAMVATVVVWLRKS